MSRWKTRAYPLKAVMISSPVITEHPVVRTVQCFVQPAEVSNGTAWVCSRYADALNKIE